MTKISIITASKNNDLTIERTILSVKNQTYKNIEHIIIDGESTDTTIDIIKRHKTPTIYWLSEPDNGIADAMNKGIKAATGEFIIFINADDYLHDKTSIASLVPQLKSNKTIYICKVFYRYKDKSIISKNKGFNWHTNFKMGSCHQGQVIPKSLFDSIGLFDTRFKIGMDYDFILRTYRSGITSTPINMVISVMPRTGISSRLDWDGLLERLNDEKTAHYKNCDSFPLKVFYTIYWSLYIPYRKLMLNIKFPGYY